MLPSHAHASARLHARTHALTQVGDRLNFGTSTRSYILNGPADLMPEDSPSLSARPDVSLREKALLAKLEASAWRKQQEAKASALAERRHQPIRFKRP